MGYRSRGGRDASEPRLQWSTILPCIAHCSLFIVHCSLLIVHCSLLIVHCSLLIVHCSLLIVHCSLFIVHCSLFIVHCSLFIVHCSFRLGRSLNLYSIQRIRGMEVFRQKAIDLSARFSG